MSKYTSRSQELAEKLRATAIANLESGEHTRMRELRKILGLNGIEVAKIERILEQMEKHW
jgi:SOS response regulatory protein OraA/RecX